MIKANYHTHLVYCNHATGHAKDYIEQAIKAGFQELGITDHAPIPECFMTSEEYQNNWCFQPMKLDVLYQSYFPEVKQAIQEYGHQLHILIGLEMEYLPGNLFYVQKLRKEVDYLNFGVHFFEYQSKVLNSYSEIDYQTIYGYLIAAIDGMRTGLFNTLVHPDLFMFHYANKNGKREFDSICEDVTRQIIQCAIENEVYLELNANGIKNSQTFSNGKEWLYPCREFWTIAKEYPDLKIIIAADAHDPLHLANQNVQNACDFADELGLKVETFMKIQH